MQKYIIISISCMISFSTAQEQSSAFLLRKLTVEVENSIIASYADWDAFLSQSMRIGGAGLVIKESRKWDGYRGGIKLSEGDFYEIAGFTEQARAASSYKSRRELFGYSGLAVFVAGTGLALYEILRAQYYDYDPEKTNIGLCLVGLGAEITGGVVAVSFLMRPPKLTPASFAVEVANDYNDRLKGSLEEK